MTCIHSRRHAVVGMNGREFRSFRLHPSSFALITSTLIMEQGIIAIFRRSSVHHACAPDDQSSTTRGRNVAALVCEQTPLACILADMYRSPSKLHVPDVQGSKVCFPSLSSLSLTQPSSSQLILISQFLAENGNRLEPGNESWGLLRVVTPNALSYVLPDIGE